MPLHLFNPACPHADPITPGPDGERALVSSRCGRCVCVPRYWVTQPPATPVTHDLSVAFFAKPIVLKRDLTNFVTDKLRNAPCQWIGPVTPPPGETRTLYWEFFWGHISPPGGGLATAGWILNAVALDPDPRYCLNAAYVVADLSPLSFFRCLAPNTFQYLPSPTSAWLGDEPPTLTLSPFWP